MRQPLSKTISDANKMMENKKTVGISLMLHERSRQIYGERWTPEHDDQHVNGELAKAAMCYIAGSMNVNGCRVWPEGWDEENFKPSQNVNANDAMTVNLMKAGALIAAEIDRIHRARSRKNSISLCLHSISEIKFIEPSISMDDLINKLKVDFDDETIKAAITNFKERLDDFSRNG